MVVCQEVIYFLKWGLKNMLNRKSFLLGSSDCVVKQAHSFLKGEPE